MKIIFVEKLVFFLISNPFQLEKIALSFVLKLEDINSQDAIQIIIKQPKFSNANIC